jgi:hypothetical protein
VEFQYEEQSLADQLSWLERGAARLKALAADTALWLEGSFAQRQLPCGLLEAFPKTVLVGGCCCCCRCCSGRSGHVASAASTDGVCQLATCSDLPITEQRCCLG